jgi:hypothetical protein
VERAFIREKFIGYKIIKNALVVFVKVQTLKKDGIFIKK